MSKIPPLSEDEILRIVDLLKRWEPIPAHYLERVEPKKVVKQEYSLDYACKEREEDIIAETWSVPFQTAKIFWNVNNDEWSNKLIFWDNLQVLKTLLKDGKLQQEIKKNGWIKLIYIDPPFATKADFSAWSWEKAYTDKVNGSEFIEFIRKRLVLMRELLSDDGSIYIHLDEKKSHYIKVIADEIFWEYNFQREIIWDIQVLSWYKTKANNWIRGHDSLFYYSKSWKCLFNKLMQPHTQSYLDSFKWVDPDGRRFMVAHWIKRYLDDVEKKWKPYWDVWSDIMSFQQQPTSAERIAYPTQKPETLLERIIRASSNDWDIVLDAFAGSGTTIAVAEKLGRKWIGIDCGKLSIYTIQKRLMNLREEIGNKGKPFSVKPFSVYNAGLYDFDKLKELSWDQYIDFCLSLFQVRAESHTIENLPFHGYIGNHHAHMFDFNHGRKWIILDYGYIDQFHQIVGRHLGKRCYMIAPASRVEFMEDVVRRWDTEYIILRVPYSIINELYNKRDFSKIRQPVAEEDVNDTVDAVGFDFIRPPVIEYEVVKQKDTIDLKLTKFVSKTISKKPIILENLESLSMCIIDYNYSGEYIDFERLLYADDIKKSDYTISLDKALLDKPCMIIWIDIFWNEKREIVDSDYFSSLA